MGLTKKVWKRVTGCHIAHPRSEKGKSNLLFQRIRSSSQLKKLLFHKSGSPHIFSFGIEFNPKHFSSPCTSITFDLGIKGASVTTTPLGSVSCEKEDDRGGRPEQARMGNFSKGKNHGGITKHAGTNKSKSHNDLGMLRNGQDASLATHLPFNTKKQNEGVASSDRPSMEGMGLPLVDISIRQTDKKGGTDLRVESAIAAISRAKLEKRGTGGRGRGKENLDVQDGGSELLGKRNFQESDSGRSCSGGGSNLLISSRENQVQWLKLADGWHKLNMDGSVVSSCGLVGCGGLLRDSAGQWVVGFAKSICSSSSIAAELWALREGLGLCLERGITAVEIELDATVAISLVSSNVNAKGDLSGVVDDCRELLLRLP
nr:putative ribonuclease h protein [Quercus suber]